MNKYSKRILAFTIISMLFVSCLYENEQDLFPQPDTSTDNIWDGDPITFVKEAGADPEDESNQDRITDDIWITRGNLGGQIYNAKTETFATKETSPQGTSWAIGEIDDHENLTFRTFRETLIKPKNVVGTNLVMRIDESGILISVKFLSWDKDAKGGFSYERSTE